MGLQGSTDWVLSLAEMALFVVNKSLPKLSAFLSLLCCQWCPAVRADVSRLLTMLGSTFFRSRVKLLILCHFMPTKAPPVMVPELMIQTQLVDFSGGQASTLGPQESLLFSQEKWQMPGEPLFLMSSLFYCAVTQRSWDRCSELLLIPPLPAFGWRYL